MTHNATVKATNLGYLRSRQFGLSVTLAAVLWPAALLYGIYSVIARSSQPEMGRITATLVVARMTNNESFRIYPGSYEVGDAMGSIILLVDPNDSISTLARSPRPRPAVSGSEYSSFSFEPIELFSGEVTHVFS